MYPGVPSTASVRVSVASPRVEAREPEVEHGDPLELLVAQEEVRGLDVAMDDAARVRDAERLGDAAHEGDGVAKTDRPARDARGERLALEPLHRDVELAARAQPVVDVAHDGGVAQRREHPRLAPEALQQLGAGAREQLERDRLAGLAIARAVDDAHAPLAGQALDLEAARHDFAETRIVTHSL